MNSLCGLPIRNPTALSSQVSLHGAKLTSMQVRRYRGFLNLSGKTSLQEAGSYSVIGASEQSTFCLLDSDKALVEGIINDDVR